MKEPNSQLVQAFWQYMTARYQSNVVDNKSALGLQLACVALGQLGIVDADRFLDHHAITVARTIYLPFEIGVPKNGWSLWQQTVVAVHEHQHVVQFDSFGPVRFAAKYLLSATQRGRLEAEAYRSNMEMHWWRFRQMPAPRELAELIRTYAVSDVDVSVAETMLRLSSESIRRGAIVNPASKVAIDWLNANAPELRVGFEN